MQASNSVRVIVNETSVIDVRGECEANIPITSNSALAPAVNDLRRRCGVAGLTDVVVVTSISDFHFEISDDLRQHLPLRIRVGGCRRRSGRRYARRSSGDDGKRHRPLSRDLDTSCAAPNPSF